ncbi:NAD(P)-dependent oxidoreductase [Microbulbifer sp. SSSA007]|uniref:NAD(P)-dependent oxidoreductase n=1 Tax=Microbulbifer sp. SSSA007 TaxID=3243379 RepID=UPI00403925AC
MKITLFGATGGLGGECLKQLLTLADDAHEVTVLVRNSKKMPLKVQNKITVIEGDVLSLDDIQRSINESTDAVLFAIGVDSSSPQNLCTIATKNIFSAFPENNPPRFIWCGGGSTFVDEDILGMSAKFVRFYAKTFLSLRHHDKENQYQFLSQHREIPWLGVRPCQMTEGELRKEYRLGFEKFGASSSISFADCAHAMLQMLSDDTWMHKAPIIQY